MSNVIYHEVVRKPKVGDKIRVKDVKEPWNVKYPELFDAEATVTRTDEFDDWSVDTTLESPPDGFLDVDYVDFVVLEEVSE